MPGKVQNIKICIPLKLYHGLIGKYYEICHYAYTTVNVCKSPTAPRLQRGLNYQQFEIPFGSANKYQLLIK